MIRASWVLFAVIVVLMLLTVPVLAKQDLSDEDQYILKPEWKNKHMVVEKHEELTQVVFMDLVVVGDNQAYEPLPYKWPASSLPVKYTINPSASVKKFKLSSSAVVGAVEQSFESWDNQVTGDLFSSPTVSSTAKASLGRRPDYKNVVTWGAISDRNVIALTNIWYNTNTLEIVDTDMVFNTYYKWGIDPDGEGTLFSVPPSTFDIRNIGTHEAGHICSLGDIYDSLYSELTMYGYGEFGEVKKISLEPGDIAGVQYVYGP